MKRRLIGFAVLLPGLAHAACTPPEERVCEEYFRSDAIFTGRVLSEKELPDTDNPEATLTTCYSLKIAEAFKGKSSGTAEVCMPKGADRRPLELGASYLLFAQRHGTANALWLNDTCRETAEELPEAEDAARAVKSFVGGLSSAMSAEIAGQVVRKPEIGVAGVVLTVSGEGKTVTGTTDSEGHFRIPVPAGHYSLAVPGAYSLAGGRADPQGFDLKYGQCADFQFAPKP